MKAEALRALALALPGAEERPHFELSAFRIKGRIFATLTLDGAELRVFGLDADRREHWQALQPARIAPLPWGGRIVGLRVALSGARAEPIGALLREAWAAKGGRAAAPAG